MFSAQVNSPELTLYSAITTTVQSTIVVSGDVANKLAGAPNLFTVGTGENAETIHFSTAPTESPAGVWTFTGCERGYDSNGVIGVAATWAAGTSVYRHQCAYDFDTFKANIEDLAIGIFNNKLLYLNAYGAVIPDTNPVYPDQTEQSGNLFPLPRLIYPHATKGTDHAFWISYMPSNWNGSTVTAQMEFSTSTQTSSNVSFVLSAKKIGSNDSYGTTLATVATITTTCNNSAANTQYLSAVTSPFSITGTTAGRTILWELKRNTGGTDTYTGTVYLNTIKILYTVS